MKFRRRKKPDTKYEEGRGERKRRTKKKWMNRRQVERENPQRKREEHDKERESEKVENIFPSKEEGRCATAKGTLKVPTRDFLDLKLRLINDLATSPGPSRIPPLSYIIFPTLYHSFIPCIFPPAFSFLPI
uniref:Uncharacterized protein n=1 Tax=Cacopsylla melanoneura TaxID=428564 RepID=A0A8D8WAZ8_9HEMI